MKVEFGPSTGLAPAPAIEVDSKVAPTAPTTEQPAQQSAPAPVPDTERSPFPPGSLTPVQHAAKTGGLMLGDTIPDFKDIILPRLNIVQGVGNLKDQFPQGAIVFNQSTVLFVPPDIDPQTGNVRRAATAPVGITVLGFRPSRFVEKIEGGGKGLIVNTEAEVRSNGGTLDYKEHKLKKASGMRLFQVLAEGLVAIERPET
jgi:hypothetical protein